MRRSLLFTILLAAFARAETIQADANDYKSKLSLLKPGDTLLLAPGDYPLGLYLNNLNGNANAWITVKGPDTGAQPRFLGDPNRGRNTVEIDNSSYLAIENLTVDGQSITSIHGISAKGTNTHHIRIEGCTIVGHGGNQGTVGISTKLPTWNWVIRRNRILGAGTGMYLGNSDGQQPFIAGLIENNLIDDPEGYCMQIKHQFSRPSVAGMPTTPQVTIVRHNVFVKSDRASRDGNRPNLLIGGLPESGAGSQDMYEIYGNFFFHNPRESLLQAEGRVSIHDNVFVDGSTNAIYLTNHNIGLRVAHVYNNTIYGGSRGVYFNVAATVAHSVVGNLIFAESPIAGSYSNASNNVTDVVAAAGAYVKSPSFVLGTMDFYPLPGKCQGSALDLSPYAGQVEYDKDFNGTSKGAFAFRGAYAGEGTNPGWKLAKAIKGTGSGTPTPPPPAPPEADTTPPTGTVTIDGGADATADLLVDLSLFASDSGSGASGMGSGAQMSFSNDGATWCPAEAFQTTRIQWSLTSYGGSSAEGPKKVYARFKDVAGNWSTAEISATIDYAVAAEPTEPGPIAWTVGCSSFGGEGSLASFLMTLASAAPIFLRLRRRA